MGKITDIYVRLSDEDRDKRNAEDESESIQNQKSMLINYCIEQGWEINRILCDEDYSGADRERPAFNQLLKDCEERKIDIVLCKTQSRFSRDMEIVEKYIHGKFLEWNIRFVSVVDHADTDVAGNKKARQINGLINEWYLEDLSDNIRKTLYHKKIKGEYCCPYAPYGYKLDPENKHHFVIDPPAAEIVRSIFEMYKCGMGYIRIAKELNKRQIPPPGIYKTMQGINYKNPNSQGASSKQWRDSTVRYILHHEVYTGAVIQGKSKNLSYKNKKRIKLPENEWIIVHDMHEPIIDKALWEDVQSLINEHRVKTKKFKEEDNSEINPLRGIVFCKECGAGMWRMSYKCADKRYKYYRCRTVKNSDGVCSNSDSIKQITIETAVANELKILINKFLDPDCIELEDKRHERGISVKEEIREIQKRLERVQDNSVQLYKDKLNGLITTEQFRILNDSFSDEITQMKKRKDMLNGELVREKSDKRSKRDIIERYCSVEKLNFELVHELIDGIYIGAKDTLTGEREIEIHWKF